MKFVKIKGTRFLMGNVDGKDGFLEDYEYPAREVTVQDFQMADTPVTNADFLKFVQATDYVTVAEKQGSSFVFHLLLSESEREQYPHVSGMPWWKQVSGANWAHPFGPNSTVNDILDHPVVHVSLVDALAYCQWANVDLPTEAQWEFAARAGVTSVFPWGDELVDGEQYHANTWQGEFPLDNTQADGYLGTAPVYTYEPNQWGLYQMIGNVWEWCRNPRYTLLDDFNTDDFVIDSGELSGEYAIRGGSFLCHCSYCNRYRLPARNGVDYLSTSSHLGFRCIRQ